MVALYCQHPNHPASPNLIFVKKHQKNTKKIPLPGAASIKAVFYS
ncbi:hypothetical protein FHW88_003076 [Mucilaginibacter sp. SG538B]|nr:hypothetical protein [Mucilaginibacter sp. SG538B]